MKQRDSLLNSEDVM